MIPFISNPRYNRTVKFSRVQWATCKENALEAEKQLVLVHAVVVSSKHITKQIVQVFWDLLQALFERV